MALPLNILLLMFLQKLMQLCVDVRGTSLPVIIYAISKKKFMMN